MKREYRLQITHVIYTTPFGDVKMHCDHVCSDTPNTTYIGLPCLKATATSEYCDCANFMIRVQFICNVCSKPVTTLLTSNQIRLYPMRQLIELGNVTLYPSKPENVRSIDDDPF